MRKPPAAVFTAAGGFLIFYYMPEQGAIPLFFSHKSRGREAESLQTISFQLILQRPTGDPQIPGGIFSVTVVELKGGDNLFPLVVRRAQLRGRILLYSWNAEQLWRKVPDFNDIRGAHYDDPFNKIPELANIFRPVVLQKGLVYLGGKLFVEAVFLTKYFQQMEKGEHTEKVKELLSALEGLPKYEHKGKKVILTGITAEPDEFLELFTECGIAVVGDDLAQESRLYRTAIPKRGTALEDLAGQWFERKGCSMVHEVESTRGSMLVEMAQAAGAQGIVVCLMRFCDVEEYDYPMIAQSAKEAGLRCLCLEIDQSTQNNEQSHTKIQSFAEMA